MGEAGRIGLKAAEEMAYWQQLYQKDEVAWKRELEQRFQHCIQETDTKVIASWDLDRPLLSSGELLGVPFASKDLFDVAGQRTRSSSLVPPAGGELATSTAACVQRFEKVGAVCVARAQMNEFAYGLTGENPHFGNCPHPRLPGRLSGGSSSGSAYLVGKGILPLALGTDTGGSIRVPAAWCGIYGVRWVPGYETEGCFPLAPSFDAVGWFAGSAEAMAQSIKAWFGAEVGAASRDLEGVLWSPEHGIEDSIRDGLKRVGRPFGCDLQGGHRDFSELMEKSVMAFNVLQSREAYAVHRSWLDRYQDSYDPAVWSRIDRGRHWASQQINEAEQTRRLIRVWFEEWFSHNDFLALPISPGPAPRSAEEAAAMRERLLGLTAIGSLAGLPALTIPFQLPGGEFSGVQFLFQNVEASVPLKIIGQCGNF